MRLRRLSWIAGLVLLAAPANAQVQACLHRGLESPVEVRRRDEALDAARMINAVLGRSVRLPSQPTRYQSWEELAASPAVGTLRGMGGPMGELARKIQWGSGEPLPGWRIHHVTGEESYAFSLTDVRDPCGFTYTSDESGVVIEGYPVETGRPGGIVPVT
jgi:hypothetical protein